METWLLRVGDRDTAATLHVHGAQWQMSGHNRFGRVWYHGKIDGVFGPASGEAARTCKFDLGYRLSAVKPTFGPLLRDYLRGEARRTALMLARARSRAQAPTWPTKPHGTVIGFPGIGTHSFVALPNNWESDNAWDIAVPERSLAVAIADGVIGPAFGPLPGDDPRFHGIRLHLVMAGNEAYYAHLHSTFPGVFPGAKVERGQTLGATGHANGVEHLHIGLKHLVPLSQL